MNCCSHTCREGRDCPRRTLEEAQRRGFLRTDDGGERVHGADTVRIPPPAQPAPHRAGFLSFLRAAVRGLLLKANR